MSSDGEKLCAQSILSSATKAIKITPVSFRVVPSGGMLLTPSATSDN